MFRLFCYSYSIHIKVRASSRFNRLHDLTETSPLKHYRANYRQEECFFLIINKY
ncbi:hypothetical protein Cabys_2957 [Caldithrix abyssi DSM 13497]|uniref:Uncharacterized protein n=1 Tax=Caldithrix abyssi DSM 13497 TaxID=880073 RepID=A0A1J1CBR1_CALAY|nr:hypothetical protein Cabys_2957 [Caldithrix abyssi DSM 13497]